MDTTERPKSLEKDLFIRQILLQAVARSFPDPIFIIDKFGKFLHVVGDRERSAYHGGKYLTGKYLQKVLPEEIADLFMLKISEAIEKNSLQTVEYLLGSEDIVGSPSDNPKGRQWYEARISPLKGYNDATNSVLWLPINITQRKNLEKQVIDLSETDPLTGACSKRYFLQIFETEFAISKRYSNKLSILHITIDRLKYINDTYGHDGGDAVLKRFTTLCQSTLRDSDLFSRWGGAGFIVMLPATPSLGAAVIAERIRAMAESLQVTYKEETIQFAISIGISQILESDKNSNALLARADSAIYKAKISGRNRIEIL